MPEFRRRVGGVIAAVAVCWFAPPKAADAADGQAIDTTAANASGSYTVGTVSGSNGTTGNAVTVTGDLSGNPSNTATITVSSGSSLTAGTSSSTTSPDGSSGMRLYMSGGTSLTVNVNSGATLTGGSSSGGGNGYSQGMFLQLLTAPTNTISITNAGSILSGNSGSSAFYINPAAASAASALSITNTGTIGASSNSASGISIANGNLSSAITINNSGSIIGGTGKAINLASSTTADQITNTGTLTAGSGGVAVRMGTHQDATLTVNGGTITGTIGSSSDGKGKVTFNASSGFTTGGQIGRADSTTNDLYLVSVTGGSLSLGHTIYANNITLSGGTTTLSTNVNVDAQAGGNLTLSGGTLDLASKTLTNAGTGGMAVTGTSSALKTTIGGASAGYVSVSGAGATFNNSGTLTVTPTVSGTTVSNGAKYLLIDNAAAPTLGTISIANGGLLTWTASVATAGGTDALGRTIDANNDIIMTASVQSASSVSGVSSTSAQSLNAVSSYSGTNTPLTNLAAAVQSLSSGSALNTAGAVLRPEINRGSIEGATQATTQGLRVIEARSAALRQAQSNGTGISTGEAMRGLAVWGQGFGFYGDQGKKDGIDGYTASTGGLAVGADARLLDPVRAGLSIGYSKTGVDDTGANSGNTNDIDSYQATLYGSYTGEPWYLNGLMAVGLHKYDTTRKVAFTGFSDTATGKHDGWQYTGKIDCGYQIPVGDVVLTPTLGGQISHLRQDGYTESSSNGAALKVNSVATTSVKSMLGGKVASTYKTEKGDLTPELRLGWHHEFKPNAVDTTASFSGGGSSFTTTSMKPGADSAVIGLGATLATKDNLSLMVNYDAEFREKYIGHNGMLQVRAEF